jgi:hypothetical protein
VRYDAPFSSGTHNWPPHPVGSGRLYADHHQRADPIGLTDPIIPPNDTDLPDPQPGEQTENIVEALINRVLIPAWNFVFTFITGSITSLWDFAGLRGGNMAQTIFCLIPGIVVTLGVLWRVFRRGR